MQELREKEIEDRIIQFEKIFRDAGVKLTFQRLEVFREVAETVEHPDAEAVYHGVRKRIPTISLDTVYRTLWMLKDLGLIKTIGAPKERTRFDANLGHHHHFVCIICGKMRDFESPDLNKVKLPESLKNIGSIETTHVEVRGICNECSSLDDT